MQSLAVIPARGGSTRLENKNIYPLGGKPLIRWITEAVVNSRCFEKVVISTDSDKIFESVADLKVSRHVRPPHHATTKATVLDAMLDLLDESKLPMDGTFGYFLPTCPFVSSDDIREGYQKIQGNPFIDSVISMTEFTETVQLACLMSNDNVIPIFDNLEHGLTNSKYLKKYYKPSGAFYMSNKYWLSTQKSFFKGTVNGVLIPRERSVDINTLEDIKYAESLL